MLMILLNRLQSRVEEGAESSSFSTSENGVEELCVGSGEGGSAKVSEVSVWELGQRVRVASSSRELCGTVSFAGEQTFAEGRWIGVTLDEPLGKNGSVDGKVYFTCGEKYGAFLKPESLRVLQLKVVPAMMEVESKVSPIVAELELVKNVEEVNVADSTPLPDDEPEDVDVVLGVVNQLEGAKVLTIGAEPA